MGPLRYQAKYGKNMGLRRNNLHINAMTHCLSVRTRCNKNKK